MALTKISTAMTKENTNTDHQRMPSGTTAQRGTGQAGDFRYNSETGEFEGFTDVWGAIGGGLDAAYFTTTPTLTNPSDNVIGVGNYSSFVDPVFTIKVGSTVLEYVDTAGSILLTSQASLEGSQTVDVEVRESGKLQNIGNTIILELFGSSARYWRMTGFVSQGSYPPAFGGWQLYPQAGQGGTKLGAATDITVSYNSYDNNREQDMYSVETNNAFSWYLGGQPGNMADQWVMYDLGSNLDVLSMRIVSPNYNPIYWSTNITIQSSTDNITWTTVHTITYTSDPVIDLVDIPQ
jgi:hypothetical protein